MAEYVEREALLKHIDAHCGVCGEARHCIIEAPAADVVERKRGEWVEMVEYYECGFGEWAEEIYYRCPNCGVDTLCTSNYCPNCGADMRGEKHES